MVDVRFRWRALPCAAALCWALGAPSVLAQIAVTDEGEQGVVLSNLEGLPDGSAPPREAPRAAPQPRARPAAPARRKDAFTPFVRAAAHAHGVPEALLEAVIETESGFNPGAVSPKGALGLMQLMPQTARDLQVRDARDPASNIDGGARYLKSLLGRYGNNLALALAAYNAGPGAVERTGGIPRIPETQAYVPRVISRYHRILSGAE
jgi:soluble lytic murein transglycosylase-like protein